MQVPHMLSVVVDVGYYMASSKKLFHTAVRMLYNLLMQS